MATTTLTTAQAGNPSSVQTVINAAASGDTIIFPAGTYSWSAGITVTKSLTLTGPVGTTGQVQFQSQMTTGYMFAMTSGTDGHIWVNGLNFLQVGNNAGSASVACWGVDRTDTNGAGSPGTQYTVIVTNCTFDSGSIFNYMIIALANGSIWSHCTFTNQFSSLGLTGISFTMPKYGIKTWNSPSTMGLQADSLLGPGGDHINVGDTTAGWCGVAGLNNCYIEDSVIQNGTSGSMNVDDNARVCIRHCTCNDLQLFSHGQDSSQYGGRQFEIYNNTFAIVNSNLNEQGWTSFRGCTGLVANNAMPNVPGKASVTFECQQINRGVGPAQCQTAYPANRQVGSGWSSTSTASYGNPVLASDGTGYVLDPFYCFGNTGTGATVIGPVNFSPGQTDTCGNGLANTVPFTSTINGTNTLSAITITPQTGLSPKLTTGMGIYDSTGKIPQGTFISSIAGSGTAPTSITMSAAASGSASGLSLVSGFITQGRDFIVGTPRPGWTAFTYPHPLLSSTVNINGTYSTAFAAPPAPENPISENGAWLNGGTTGVAWTNVTTTSGFAFGTQPGNATGNAQYADSVAILTGTWSPNQQAQATVKIISATNSASIFQEVELHLRSAVTANSLTGYEINLSVSKNSSNFYMQIVRWNGALGSFTQLDGATIQSANNDTIMATISGPANAVVITAFHNSTQVMQITDTAGFASGNPGMGFFLQGTTGINNQYGFSAFSAQNTGGSGPTNVNATVIIR